MSRVAEDRLYEHYGHYGYRAGYPIREDRYLSRLGTHAPPKRARSSAPPHRPV